MHDRLNVSDAIGASVIMRPNLVEQMDVHGVYTIECLDADGNLKWVETIDNLVVTVGKNFLLDNGMAGSAYTAAFSIGLVDGGSAPTFAAADTMGSHAGWTEFTNYSSATRIAPTWNAASAGSKSTTVTAFTINGVGGTVAGAFMTTNNTKGGTTGTLFSGGAFGGGSRVVANTDTLNVTYSLSA